MQLVPQPQNSDRGAVLRTVAERAQVLTRGTGAALALGHKRAMICRASVGDAPRLGWQLDVSTGLSGECVRTGKAIRCDDSSNDPRVDAEICSRLGIRSILAAPIPFEGEIVGLLEVFSSQRFAFHDGDLAVVESLAEMALPVPSPKPTPPPKLLLKQEPAYRVFLDNLIDMARPARTAPLKLTSRPARFWPDVFVPSPLPWDRFVQSLMLHVMMVATLLTILQFGIARPRLVPRDPLSFSKSDIIYYVPAEYLPLIKKESVPVRTRPTLTYPKQAPLAVRRESRRPTQASIVPPEIHAKLDLSLARIMARNSAPPVVPLSATMRTQLTTPAAKVSAVAPPPDISAASRTQYITPAAQVVVAPAPSVHFAIRQTASLNIGQLRVVGPAPEVYENGVPLQVAQRILGSTQATVVPPAPTVGSLGKTEQRVASLPDGTVRVVPPAPLLQLAGAYLRGNPEGKVIVVVPPPPSVQGFDRSGAQHSGSLPGASVQVVPPAPLITTAGAGGTRAFRGGVVSVVSPAPSVDHLGYPGAQRVNSIQAGVVQPAAPPVAIKTNASKNGATIAMATGLPGGLLPGELVSNSKAEFGDAKDFPDAKELNVNFIGPALVLPASSYFLSYEVFIAEERLSRHQTRLIKLVYDFLPYQPRLSAYGPNYPAIENLHATRDPSCDETLAQVEASAKAVHWSQVDRTQLSTKSAKQRQSSLPCYRTTADEYRRARTRQRPD